MATASLSALVNVNISSRLYYVATSDGRSYHEYKDYLEGLEKKAGAAEIGAWGL